MASWEMINSKIVTKINGKLVVEVLTFSKHLNSPTATQILNSSIVELHLTRSNYQIIMPIGEDTMIGETKTFVVSDIVPDSPGVIKIYFGKNNNNVQCLSKDKPSAKFIFLSGQWCAL